MTPAAVYVVPAYEVCLWINQLVLYPERSGLSLLEAAPVDAETASLMGRDTVSDS